MGADLSCRSRPPFAWPSPDLVITRAGSAGPKSCRGEAILSHPVRAGAAGTPRGPASGWTGDWVVRARPNVLGRPRAPRRAGPAESPRGGGGDRRAASTGGAGRAGGPALGGLAADRPGGKAGAARPGAGASSEPAGKARGLVMQADSPAAGLARGDGWGGQPPALAGAGAPRGYLRNRWRSPELIGVSGRAGRMDAVVAIHTGLSARFAPIGPLPAPLAARRRACGACCRCGPRRARGGARDAEFSPVSRSRQLASALTIGWC